MNFRQIIGTPNRLLSESRHHNFFSLGKNKVYSGGMPLILVHPFYFKEQKYFQYGLTNDGKDYSKNILELISDFDTGNILLFEEPENKEETINKIRNIRGLDGVFLVRTQPGKADPILADQGLAWQRAGEFVKCFSKKVCFAGGVVADLYNSGDQRGGCLGEVRYQFGRQKITGELLAGCCYTGRMKTPEIWPRK
jgi:hypothetical protein